MRNISLYYSSALRRVVSLMEKHLPVLSSVIQMGIITHGKHLPEIFLHFLRWWYHSWETLLIASWITGDHGKSQCKKIPLALKLGP